MEEVTEMVKCEACGANCSAHKTDMPGECECDKSTCSCEHCVPATPEEVV